MLNEISQTEKDKYCMVSLICRNKKKGQTYRNRERDQTTCGYKKDKILFIRKGPGMKRIGGR